jgi:hypothetical protein
MRPTLLAAALLAVTVGTGPAQEGGAGTPVRSLDLTADGRLFDQWFQRFGYHPGRTVAPERAGVRFQLPALKEEAMIGYSSAFSLAGDFEVQIDLEIVSLPPPTAGYGPAIGLTVDAEAPDGSVGLTRGLSAEGKSQFVVARVAPPSATGGAKFGADVYPTSGPRARLVLRREKAEVVCLASDRPGVEPRELKRVPFTDRRVRYLRLHASNGGSPTPVTGRLTGVRVKADEIVGGITRTELAAVRSYWWWWIPVAAGSLAAAWVVRRYRRRDSEPGERAAGTGRPAGRPATGGRA